MNLEQFATEAGVTIERCDKEWGGTWAYKCTDSPHITCCGYRNKQEAHKAWMAETFGEQSSKALIKLLKDK